MRIYEGTIAYEVLKTIGICGEYPFNSLHLIPGRHLWVLRVVSQLERERYINRSGQGQLKKLRLMQRGYNFLLSVNEPVAKQYSLVFDTENRAGDLKHVWRDTRLSETIQMMRRAEVRVACYEKPELLSFESTEQVSNHISAFYANEPVQYPVFYTSREIKNTKPKERSKTKYSRMNGAFITEDTVFAVYNLNKGLLKYSADSEIKIRELLHQVIRKNGWNNQTEGVSFSTAFKSIVICRNKKTALKFLAASGEEHKSENFRIDDNFKTLNYVPMDENGIRFLRIMGQPDYRNRIWNEVVSKDVSTKHMSLTVDVDGWDNTTNTYYFVFLDSDLKRLLKLKNSLKNECFKDGHLSISCFPWQEELVEEYIPQAIIEPYEFSEIEKIFDIHVDDSKESRNNVDNEETETVSDKN